MLALSLCVCGPAFAQPEDPADVATARELFREGLELSKQEKWEEAREKLGQSLALKKAALTYYTLAVADKRSNHLVAALEHFRGFLAQPVTEKTEAFVEPAREAVAELEKRVGGITVQIKPQGLGGLVVRLDGEDIPHSAIGRRRLVDPGEHVVTARADGWLPHTQKVTVGEGENRAITLSLRRAADGDGAEVDEAEFPLLPVILMAGGGAVGIAGLVVGIIGAGEASDAPTQDGPEADAAIVKTVVGDVMMGVGGAVAAVGLVLLIVHLTDEPDEASPSDAEQALVRPWAEGGVGGIEIRF